MTPPIPQQRVTPEEYLAHERAAEVKSEYIAGQIYAMSGAGRAHGLINMNLSRLLSTQLGDQPCEAFASDMRVKVSAARLYTYPDLVVVCGEPLFEDAQVDTLLNPTLIVEVLSPSTEAYDRGAKFAYYRQLPSLREYLLVAQDRILLDHFLRDEAGWRFTSAADPTAVATLPAIGCALPVAEVYHKVAFAAEPPPAADAG